MGQEDKMLFSLRLIIDTSHKLFEVCLKLYNIRTVVGLSHRGGRQTLIEPDPITANESR